MRHSSDSRNRKRGVIEPPYDSYAERVTLGALLLVASDEQRAAILDVVTAEDFYDPLHRAAFVAIAAAHARGVVDTFVVVGSALRGQHDDPPALLRGLLDDVGTTYEGVEAAQIVAKQARSRRALELAVRQQEAASKGDLERVREIAEQLLSIDQERDDSDPVVDAATFVRQANTDEPPLWGKHDSVLWTPGETLWICGPTGVGKTTVAQQLALARAGLLSDLLGFPVERDQGRLLYIAADRPKQAARSLARMLSDDELSVFGELCVVWPGPLPYDLASRPSGLIELAHRHEAGTVLIDSLKDIALDLSKDEAGSRVNYALNAAVSAGIEVVVLHHQRKGQQGRKPTTLEDVYGSTWLMAGAGSVLLLWGSAGDPIVELTHLKQPVGDVGPLRLMHDQRTGRSSVIDQPDLVELARFSRDGLTARDAARHLWEKEEPGKNDVEKARRRLDALAERGLLVRREGGRGGSGDGRNPSRWYATTSREEPT